MPVDITINLDIITTSVGQATDGSHSAVANQVRQDDNLYAPYLAGDLQSQSGVSADGKEVFWNAVYSHYQYIGIHPDTGKVFDYTKTHNPNAQSRWHEKGLAIHGDEWVALADKEVKKNL